MAIITTNVYSNQQSLTKTCLGTPPPPPKKKKKVEVKVKGGGEIIYSMKKEITNFWTIIDHSYYYN